VDMGILRDFMAILRESAGGLLANCKFLAHKDNLSSWDFLRKVF